MAKFTRHDPSNKKKDRNKKLSLDSDVRIKPIAEHKAIQLLREVAFDDENDPDFTEPQQLNS